MEIYFLNLIWIKLASLLSYMRSIRLNIYFKSLLSLCLLKLCTVLCTDGCVGMCEYVYRHSFNF